MRCTTTILLGLCLTVSQLIAQQGFQEVSAEAGINHAFRVDQATFGGGVAVFDYDNDGWEDLYVTGGADADVLYRNEGDGTFSNVLPGSGLELTNGYYTQGVAAADIDGDGDKDLVISTFSDLTPAKAIAPNLLFINEGNGRFTEMTSEWGLEDYRVNSCGVSFGDINGDGYPDMFISNYYSTTARGVNVYNEQTITNSFTPALDYLFLNTGGQGFVEVSDLYGILEDGFGFHGLFTDYDVDGDLDLLVVNDFGFRRTPNRLYRNNFPERKFTDRSLQQAMNYGMNAMGVAYGDYNFDGRQDFVVTNLGTSVFSVNQGAEAPFADYTFFSGIGTPQIQDSLYTGLPISWGANFFDFDNDTDLDLFVCNGALNPTIRLNPNLFYVCDEDLKYTMQAREYGLFHYGIGRGSVTFDYDKDGDLDLFVVNQHPRDATDLGGTMPAPRCLLYRNEAAEGNWLQIELAGKRSTTHGLGSRVVVYSNGRMQTREIDGGSSHLSQNSTIAHFGLGEASTIDSVVVHWIGGKRQSLTNVSPNQILRIEQAEARVAANSELQIAAFPTSFINDLYIEFELGSSGGKLEIALVDLSGRQVAQIYHSDQAPATGLVRWQPDYPMNTGIYYLRMWHEGQVVSTPVSSIRP